MEDVGLADVQRALLLSRAALLKELGLEEALSAQRAVAAGSGGAGRKRRRAGEPPPAPARASSRVRGVGAPSAGLGESADAGPLADKRARGSSSGGAGAAAAAAGAAGEIESKGPSGPLGAVVKALVEKDCTIKAFVEGALGIVPYRAGRGYHELKEDIPISSACHRSLLCAAFPAVFYPLQVLTRIPFVSTLCSLHY